MNFNLPKHLEDYLKLLKKDERFQELLKAIPVPIAHREWAPDFEEATWAYQTGLTRGVKIILALFGRGPSEQPILNKE